MDARAAEKGMVMLKMDEAKTIAREEYRQALCVGSPEGPCNMNTRLLPPRSSMCWRLTSCV